MDRLTGSTINRYARRRDSGNSRRMRRTTASVWSVTVDISLRGHQYVSESSFSKPTATPRRRAITVRSPLWVACGLPSDRSPSPQARSGRRQDFVRNEWGGLSIRKRCSERPTRRPEAATVADLFKWRLSGVRGDHQNARNGRLAAFRLLPRIPFDFGFKSSIGACTESQPPRAAAAPPGRLAGAVGGGSGVVPLLERGYHP